MWAEFLQNHCEKNNKVCFFLLKWWKKHRNWKTAGKRSSAVLLLLFRMANCRCIHNLRRFSVSFLMTGTCWKVQTRGGVNGGWLPQRQAVTVQTLPQGHTTTTTTTTIPTSHSRNSSTIVGSASVFVWVWALSSSKSADFSCLPLLGDIWNLHKLLGKNAKHHRADEINFFPHLYSLLINDGKTFILVYFWL